MPDPNLSPGTITAPLRWSQTPDGAWTLRAGSIAAGRVTRGCGAEPSWLGTSFGGSLAYHGASIADAMEAVLLDVTRVLAGVDTSPLVVGGSE